MPLFMHGVYFSHRWSVVCLVSHENEHYDPEEGFSAYDIILFIQGISENIPITDLQSCTLMNSQVGTTHVLGIV